MCSFFSSIKHFFPNCVQSVKMLDGLFPSGSEGEDVAVSLTGMSPVTFAHLVNLEGPDVLYYYIFLQPHQQQQTPKATK